MTAKEYLSQARGIIIQLRTMEEQLQFLKSVAEYRSVPYSNAPKPTRNIHRNEDAVVSLIEFTERMSAEHTKLNEIRAVINSVDDPTRQTVLVKRYLLAMRWVDVADETHYSLPRIYEIHRAALADVETLLTVHSKT